MNKSYSKIRHMVKSNLILEERRIINESDNSGCLREAGFTRESIGGTMTRSIVYVKTHGGITYQIGITGSDIASSELKMIENGTARYCSWSCDSSSPIGIKTSGCKVEKRPLSEDNFQGGGTDGMGRGTGYHRETIENVIKTSYTFDKDKMKTGSDVVDVSSPEYGQLKSQLETIVKSSKVDGPVNVTVTGGASAVGNSSGYNNPALAKSRANKLVVQLSKDIPNLGSKVEFITKGIVGKSTKLNSVEAYNEQFVKVNFDVNEINRIKQMIELDNTTVYPYLGGLKKSDLKKDDGKMPDFSKKKMKRVCVQIPEKYVDEFRLKVREFRGSHLDIGTIPFGVSDID